MNRRSPHTRRYSAKVLSRGREKTGVAAGNRPASILDGMRFGSLTVIRPFTSGPYRGMHECACDCGGIKIARATRLRSGMTRHCGCGPLHTGPKPLDVKTRLARKIDMSGGASACWPWTGKRNGNGYGRYYLSARTSDTAHRVAYREYVGPIPDGLWVLHKCDNPCCCNPAHLFLGTVADNVHDMIRKGRASWQRNKERDQGRFAKAGS